MAYFFKDKPVYLKNYISVVYRSDIGISGILTLRNYSDSIFKFSRCFTCHSTKATKPALFDLIRPPSQMYRENHINMHIHANIWRATFKPLDVSCDTLTWPI